MQDSHCLSHNFPRRGLELCVRQVLVQSKCLLFSPSSTDSKLKWWMITADLPSGYLSTFPVN